MIIGLFKLGHWAKVKLKSEFYIQNCKEGILSELSSYLFSHSI